ncbi:carbonic anhydrase 1-like [Mercenaria mercenaria]|uniref:carbonic anhydrase 1-like n=1 Tax=Mercenaria mercenaria TaxID=6596 RepID=UPI00234E46C2|nr:carbonic anhydrase 1-like [Mercenaria mercenaria]
MRRKQEVMEISIVAFLIFSACLTIYHGVDAQHHWSYRNYNGPEKWPEMYPSQCTGYYQSPVDIRTDETRCNLQLTTFGFYDPPQGGKFIAHNNAHSIQVDTNGQFFLAYGGLQDRYRISQLHFHWGSSNDKGSEHKINDEAAPMEMHIVSWNVDKYSSMAEAVTKPDGLAVLSILFRVSYYDNPLLEPLVQVIPYIRDPEWNNSVEIPCVAISAFLPRCPEKYYRYHGSLTTPRCYESVTWTVFKEKQTISERQLYYFRSALMAHTTKEFPIPHTPHTIVNPSGEILDLLVDNARPTQPLNGRVIERSFPYLDVV